MTQPYVFLLLTYVSAVLSQHLGNLIRLHDPKASTSWAPWVSIAVFFVVILIVRKWEFRKIFFYGTTLAILMLIASVFIFSKSEVGFFLSSELTAKLLPVLGWGYVNQIATRSEGEKSYFLLHFLVGLSVTPLSFLPQFAIANSSAYIWILLSGATLCTLVASFMLKKSEIPQSEDATFQPFSWVLAAILGFLAAGIRFVDILNASLVGIKIRAAATTGAEFSAILGKYAMIVGTGTLALSLLSLWLGPLILKWKNWSFAVMSAIVIAILGTLMIQLSSNPYLFASYMALLGGLQYFWIFPLIQIAVLAFDLKSRFEIQAIIFLIVAPLIENSSIFINGSPLSLSLISLIILSTMAVLVRKTTKARYIS